MLDGSLPGASVGRRRFTYLYSLDSQGNAQLRTYFDRFKPLDVKNDKIVWNVFDIGKKKVNGFGDFRVCVWVGFLSKKKTQVRFVKNV